MIDTPGIGILAGGKSRRMGRNKAFLSFQGETMLGRLLRLFREYSEVTISSADYGLYEDYGFPVVYDQDTGIGPIEGICRLLEHSTRNYIFICAVDMPFVEESIVSYLVGLISEGTDCVCLTMDGLRQPLCALYSKKALPFFMKRKAEGCYRISEVLNDMNTSFFALEDSPLSRKSMKNINSPEDYQKISTPFIFCVSGIKNSGKTGLIERLIPLFTQDGYKVGVIKHDGHNFEIDHEGTDSWRFSQVGASVSVIYSARQYAVVSHIPPQIDELLFHCRDMDVVIIEGLKDSHYPKVEVLRKENHHLPVCRPETWICLALDDGRSVAEHLVPEFDLNDTIAIYDCVRMYMENRT